MKRCILIAALFASLMACNNTPDRHFALQPTLTEFGHVDVFVDHDLPDDHVITVDVFREYVVVLDDTLTLRHYYHEVSFPAHEWRSGKRLYLSDYDFVHGSDGSDGVSDFRYYLAGISDDIQINASRRETGFVEDVASLAYMYAGADTVVYRPLDADLKDSLLDY